MRFLRSLVPAAALGAASLVLAGGSLWALAPQEPADKAEALLKQMTLDEKIGQMVQVDLAALADKNDIAKYFMGSVLCGGGSDPAPDNLPSTWVHANDTCQAVSQHTRLKVPLLFGIDAVHGHNNVQGAVVFPHNINLGATRNPKLVEEAAKVAAREIVGTGMRWAFAPCVAVARDERWGRTYESFSEDPSLVSEMGAAYVRGLQGAKLSAEPFSVLACVKHYAGDGGTTGGKDQGDTALDESTLRNTHIFPYRAAIDAGADSIMVSYNTWNGVKLHASKELLTNVLKHELGFHGFLVSDWAAIDQIDPTSYIKCIEQSINAGLDMVMIPNGLDKPNNYVNFIDGLKQLVADGKVSQERIDDAAGRILRVKAKMGLLDHAPAPTNKAATAMIGSPEHREVARECVRQSAVLLKNEGSMLPLKPGLKHIAVVGQAASDLGMQCGGWTIDWQGKPGEVTAGGTTLIQALQAAGLQGTQVTYSAEGKIEGNPDLILVVLGEKPYAEMFGDRFNLSLPANDHALVSAAKRTGKPVVTLLYSGRPLILGDVLTHSDALVAAFLPGTEGAGLADLLLGKAPFVGKLPCTWSASMIQIPFNQGDTAKGDPQFPFGHGLTTTVAK